MQRRTVDVPRNIESDLGVFELSPRSAWYAEAMMKTIPEVAHELAQAHRLEDPDTKSVFLAESDSEVRLVEVSGSVGTSGEVLPFRFAPRPDLGVPYASVVVLLSEDDWHRVERGSLSLPDGWGEFDALQAI